MTVKRAKGGIANVNVDDVTWVQWTVKKTGKLTAFAVDPDSERRTGKLRALNGSLVPETAEPAKDETDRDPFSISLVEQLKAKTFSRIKKQERQAEREKAREAKRTEKAAKKAEREANILNKKVKEQLPPVEPFTGIRRKDGKPLGHPQDYADSHYQVVIQDKVVAEVEREKVDPDAEVVFRFTDKSWGVYQNKARRAFGKL